MGSHLSLFLFYILPQLIFLTSNSLWRIGLFFACDFLSPVAGANVMLPCGVPFESLYFLYLTLSSNFGSQILKRNLHFFSPPIFILTGSWRQGLLVCSVYFDFVRNNVYCLVCSSECVVCTLKCVVCNMCSV